MKLGYKGAQNHS